MSQINELQKIGKMATFEKNQIVFAQDDPGDSMYVALSGAFGVYINSFTDFPVRVAGIVKGQPFGEMSVIDGWPRSATIISEGDGKNLAYAIHKDYFEQLLTADQAMANRILQTLIGRVDATAEKLRSAGKDIPDLPADLKNPQPQDAHQMHQVMIMLAQRIREFNEMLGADAPPPAPEAAPQGQLSLLPTEYTAFLKEEQFDSANLLTQKDVVCPYCKARVKAYIPIFSRLIQKESSLDQRVTHENLDVLWYANVVCHNCNYTDTYQQFTKETLPLLKPKYTENQFINAEGFEGFATGNKRTLDEVIMSYYLNIECLRRTSGDPLRLGNAWLKLYWIYSDHNRKDFMMQAAQKAQSYFLNVKEQLLNTDEAMRVNAILGELSVSLGDKSKAIGYFQENVMLGRALDSDFAMQNVKRYTELTSM